jgi:hypothetical protein
VQVINSKQRPRKLTIYGNDGSEYQFLLKGHEDLRQDERVMQLFGLVNNLLAADRNTSDRNLSIARYAVIPLSPNSGLIGWVRNCDTLHALIREYRDSRGIALNEEHRIMQSLAPNYDMMMVIQKVEVFEDALERTSGEDLHKVSSGPTFCVDRAFDRVPHGVLDCVLDLCAIGNELGADAVMLSVLEEAESSCVLCLAMVCELWGARLPLGGGIVWEADRAHSCLRQQLHDARTPVGQQLHVSMRAPTGRHASSLVTCTTWCSGPLAQEPQ